MNVPSCLKSISPRWATILEMYGIDEIINGVFPPDNSFIDIEDENEIYKRQRQGNVDILDISQFSCCIVGEAHNLRNFKPDRTAENPQVNEYDCHECENMSYNFYNMMVDMEDDDTMYSDEDFEDNIEVFCEHIKDKHPELIKTQEKCE